jgi:hypothetical protein
MVKVEVRLPCCADAEPELLLFAWHSRPKLLHQPRDLNR